MRVMKNGLNDLPSIYDYDDALFPGKAVLTLRFVPGPWKRREGAVKTARFA